MLDSIQTTDNNESDLWLLWGIITGLIGEPIKRHSDEQATLSNLQDFLEKRSAKRTEKVKKSQEEKPDKRFEIRKQRIDRIHDILKEYDLAPNPKINEALLRGINSDPVESNKEFCEELDCLLSETPLRQTNQLEQATEFDLDAISNKAIQGVSAESVFEAVLDRSTDEYLSSDTHPTEQTELKDNLDDNIYQKSFTRALRFLADEYDNEYDRYQWPHYSIVTESKSGWEISQYGRLLAYCKHGPQQGTAWMYKPWEFPDYTTDGWKEYVLPAINEISVGEHSHQSILKYNPHI